MKVLIIGAGYMCEEYYKTLKGLNINDIYIVGRNEKNILKMKNNFNIQNTFIGGFENFLINYNDKIFFDLIINTVNVENLFYINKLILNSNLGNLILSEKPACLNIKEAKMLNKIAKNKKKNFFIAYNRRFYSSVLKVREIIETNKIESLFFSFNEILERIDEINYPKLIKQNLIISNSSHVIDLVLNIIGNPKILNAFFTKKSENYNYYIYYGLGVSEKNIPFIYHSNWLSKGRWLIEIYCKEFKLILCPLEKLTIQKDNFGRELEIINEDEDDIKFKPGLKKMLEALMNKNKLYDLLCTIDELEKKLLIYQKIGGIKN
ncbi:MAG: gfo/Idh/MocA family oxidoreductase [Spirochaetes bacterium]|nr:gfo/Idh/MocA family oxidoreductase [Spirochaetota bacterium]